MFQKPIPLLAATLMSMSEFAQARVHAEYGMSLYDVQHHHAHAFLYAQDPGMTCLIYEAWILWCLGYSEQARQRVQDAVRLARNLSHPFSLAWAHSFAASIHQLRREPPLAQEQAERVLLYLHGGGYMLCSVSTHRELISRIARAAGMRALGVNYRLAPEHPFPAALEDATTTYRWLVSHGTAPEYIAIAGDSAGGGLTLATLVALRDAGDPLPATAVCLSPWVDLEGTGPSNTTKAEADPFVRKEMIQFLAEQYLGGRDPRMPLAAPLYADLHGLPPLLMQVGTAEILLDDATRTADRAKAAGVEVSLEVWDDMIHVWQLFAPLLPEGQQAIERIGAFIRQHMR